MLENSTPPGKSWEDVVLKQLTTSTSKIICKHYLFVSGPPHQRKNLLHTKNPQKIFCEFRQWAFCLPLWRFLDLRPVNLKKIPGFQRIQRTGSPVRQTPRLDNRKWGFAATLRGRAPGWSSSWDGSVSVP